MDFTQADGDGLRGPPVRDPRDARRRRPLRNRASVTPENIGRTARPSTSGHGDLLIDLAWNIDAGDDPPVVPRPRRALHQHVGRAVGPLRGRRSPARRTERTLYVRHMALRERVRGLARAGPDRGRRARRQPRPGLALDEGRRWRTSPARCSAAPSPSCDGRRRERLERRAARRATTPRLAMRTGRQGDPHLRARHPDHQPAQGGRRVRQHVVVEGFYEEGIAPAEMGWGTHERTLPPGACTPRRRARQPDLPGADGHGHCVRSWVPLGGADHRHGRSATARRSRSPTT